MGIWHGEGTIYENVPDLYFFLELKQGSEAQKKFDAQGAKVMDAVARLQGKIPDARWAYDPGQWQIVWACKSLVEVARADDPARVTTDFFRECLALLREVKVMDLFLKVAR
jgi:hypothetical protein